MLASKLLEQLQALIAEHGDRELSPGIDDFCLQGVDFIPATLTGPFRHEAMLQLDFECADVCCIHCGKACAEEKLTGEDRYGQIWEYLWPDACPDCGKNPQE